LYLQNKIKTNKIKKLRHQPSKSCLTWALDVLKSCYDIDTLGIFFMMHTLGIGVVFWSRCSATSIISSSRKPDSKDLFTFNDSNLTKHGGGAFFEMRFERKSCTIRVNLRHF